MYKVGDVVIYGKQGVCRIVKVGPISISSAINDTLYYTLEPVYGNGKTYTPIDTKVFMRPVMTLEEVQEIIKEIPNIENHLNENNTTREMAEYYKASLNSNRLEDLIQVIKTVYEKEKLIKEQGKKLGQTDERYKKEAEDLLYQEFAVALEIPVETVEEYITKCIDGDKVGS
ncbi:MAG: CarD family transcriptional regulator [Coprobacillaceae bacterium]